ncbi:putative membrane protein [Exiguobacterium sp. S17]|nr:putative membrane protein [Exiguobacterium sp. S17]
MRREQHILRLVDYARQGKAKTFMIGMTSIIVTGTLLRTVELTHPLLVALGFLGVVPLLVREWKLGTIRRSFNENPTYQRLVRLPFWLTSIGFLGFLGLLWWNDVGSSGMTFLIPLAALLFTVFALQRTFDRIILKIEPDYITDHELHRELN